MVSTEKQARAKAASRRRANRANLALANEAKNRARREVSTHPSSQRSSQPSSHPSSQPRDGRSDNRVVTSSSQIPQQEFNRLPHGQIVRGGIVRADGIDPQWPKKLIRLYECWWMVSLNQHSSSLSNFELRTWI